MQNKMLDCHQHLPLTVVLAQIRICYGGSPFRPDGCGGDCIGDMAGHSSGVQSNAQTHAIFIPLTCKDRCL